MEVEMKVDTIIKYNILIKDIIDNAQDVNALIKFKLLGILKQFEPIVENFETVRDEKIRKYGTEGDNGTYGIFVPKREKFDSDDDYNNDIKEYEDAMNNLNKELKEVADSKVEVEFNKFKSVDIMNAGIPANYLVALYELIEE